MTALDAANFAEPSPRTPGLRPAVIAIVVALHAGALGVIPFLAPAPPEKPRQIVVDIVPETVTAEAPSTAPPRAEAQPEAAPAQPPLPEPAHQTPPVEAAPPPIPALETAPREPTPAPPPPPVALAPPDLASPPRPPPERAEPAPPPQAEMPRPESNVRSRVAPPKAEPKVEPRSLRRTEPAEKRPQASERAASSQEAPSRRASEGSAMSPAAYGSAVSAAIHGRLFYPPAARARGAKGVVGVGFTIGASGAVSSFRITRSSGDADLDAAARSLVQSTHFPPPPGGSTQIVTSFNYAPR